MTRGDLIRHIALEFGLDQNASSDEQLLMVDWANDGVRRVLLETHVRVELGSIPLTLSVGDYRLDSTVMAIDERTNSASTVKLKIVSPEQIYDYRRVGAANAELTYIAIQGDLLMVYPTPSTSPAPTLTIVYVAAPSPMGADANDLGNSVYGGLPVYAQNAVLDYMRYRAALYDERRAPHTPNDYLTFFEKEVGNVRKRMRRVTGRAALGLNAGYPGRALSAGTRNDRYPQVD